MLNIFGNDYHTRDGTCIRDFIHIRDLIEAHISSIEFIINNNFPIKIYNIGTGKGYTLLEIVNNFNTQLLSMNKDIINYKSTQLFFNIIRHIKYIKYVRRLTSSAIRTP